MEEKLLFDKYLRKIDYTFRRSGLYLRNRKNYNVTKARLLYCFNFILVNLDVGGSLVYIAKGEGKEDGLVAITHSLPSAILALLCDFKSLSFMWYHSYVDKLVFILRELETKADLDIVANKTCIEEPIKFLQFALRVSSFSNWLLILAYPLMPLSISIYNYFALNKVDLVLPFLIEYPFDAYDIRIYPFVLLNNFYAEMMAIFWIFSSESFYYTCATFIIVQFKLLQRQILTITPERSGNNGGRLNDDEVFQTKIMELIIWHQELIEAVKIIETIYSKSTLFNFMSSSAMICLVGFNVTTIGDVAFVVMFFSFLCLSLVQIFFLCFFGDMIMRSSYEVSDAIYNSKWYTKRAKHSRILHFLQMRAQKPCKLTAYGFADVNLIAFSKIMKTSWSYFALLKTVNK